MLIAFKSTKFARSSDAPKMQALLERHIIVVMRNLFLRILALVLLLPAIAFPYTVVRKDGRSFDGELISESKELLVLKDRIGIEVQFRVDQLDMDRTRAANVSTAKVKTMAPFFPTTEIRHSASGWTGERITIDFKDIDIRDFFRFIAEISEMNLIVDPAVKGSLTIKLTEVPWDQALDLVCRSHGLGYEIDGNVLSMKKFR